MLSPKRMAAQRGQINNHRKIAGLQECDEVDQKEDGIEREHTKRTDHPANVLFGKDPAQQVGNNYDHGKDTRHDKEETVTAFCRQIKPHVDKKLGKICREQKIGPRKDHGKDVDNRQKDDGKQRATCTAVLVAFLIVELLLIHEDTSIKIIKILYHSLKSLSIILKKYLKSLVKNIKR